MPVLAAPAGRSGGHGAGPLLRERHDVGVRPATPDAGGGDRLRPDAVALAKARLGKNPSSKATSQPSVVGATPG
jgi:hypothetical protein